MVLVVVTIVVPPQTLLIPQYLRFQKFDIFGIFTLLTGEPLNLLNQPYTLYLLAATGFGIKQGIFIFIFRQFFKGLPIELEEAAYMEGCKARQIFTKVIMPITKPSFATVAIFTFLWSYNDLFTQSFFLRTKQKYTITMLLNMISSNEGTNYGLMAAAVTLVVVPVLIVYIFLQKYIIKGMTAGAIKG